MFNTTNFNATLTANDALLDHCIEHESGRGVGLKHDPSCFLHAAQNPLFTLAGLIFDPATGDGIDHSVTAAQLGVPDNLMHARVASGVPLADFERYMGRIALAWLRNHRAVLLMQYMEVHPHLLAQALGIENAAPKNEPLTAVMQESLALAA